MAHFNRDLVSLTPDEITMELSNSLVCSRDEPDMLMQVLCDYALADLVCRALLYIFVRFSIIYIYIYLIAIWRHPFFVNLYLEDMHNVQAILFKFHFFSFFFCLVYILPF